MTPTPWKAEDLSLAERCLRLPTLVRAPRELPQLQIREAVWQHLLLGLTAMYAGTPDEGREHTCESFMSGAVVPGYLYPDHGDPYVIVNDYASWLDSALHLAAEFHAPALAVPTLTLPSGSIHTDAWVTADGVAHVYRIVSHRLADTSPGSEDAEPETVPTPSARWPELIAACHPSVKRVRLVRLRLPPFRRYRLHSPLMLARQHPMTGQLRLARVRNEASDKSLSSRERGPQRFADSWKCVGRWERPDIDWPEWREGLDRDQCYGSVVDAHEYAVTLDHEAVREDADRLLRLLSDGMDNPRLREACEHCEFKEVCHARAAQGLADIPDGRVGEVVPALQIT